MTTANAAPHTATVTRDHLAEVLRDHGLDATPLVTDQVFAALAAAQLVAGPVEIGTSRSLSVAGRDLVHAVFGAARDGQARPVTSNGDVIAVVVPVTGKDA